MNPQIKTLESLIARLPGTEAGKQASSHLQEIKMLAEAVEHHRKNPDEMKSEKANSLVVEAARTRLMDAIQKVHVRINALVDAESKALDAQQIRQANLVPDEYAAEIRQVYRSLDESGRLDYLKKAVARGDGAAVAAIVNAPASVTFLTRERADEYRTAFFASHAPVDRAPVDEIRTAADVALRTASTI
ncbi:hypothetical protein ACFQUU_16435 [Herbaspirillum sp. GCM10030257]|uniref:hypothetical protein n=1 Tax=Herbaspirillum sp. GCM10030257 TaxID=3273393 RepID=UPI0036123791